MLGKLLETARLFCLGKVFPGQLPNADSAFPLSIIYERHFCIFPCGNSLSPLIPICKKTFRLSRLRRGKSSRKQDEEIEEPMLHFRSSESEWPPEKALGKRYRPWHLLLPSNVDSWMRDLPIMYIFKTLLVLIFAEKANGQSSSLSRKRHARGRIVEFSRSSSVTRVDGLLKPNLPLSPVLRLFVGHWEFPGDPTKLLGGSIPPRR